MADQELRFVMDGPEHIRTRRRKRSRMVTACDACRLKKVKCFKPNPRLACNSCLSAGTSCMYHDRDNYHLQRGVAFSTRPIPPTTTPSLIISPTPAEFSDMTSTLISPALTSSPSTQPSPLESNNSSLPPTPNDADASFPREIITDYDAQRDMNTLFLRSLLPSSLPDALAEADLHQQHQSFTSAGNGDGTPALPNDFAHLFNLKRPRYPNKDLLTHLTNLFFDYLACHFPFLSREAALSRVKSGTLPAVLANSIAALGSRFSNRPEILRGGSRYAAGEAYLQTAKVQIAPMMSWPSIDVLHSLILISWAEYGSGRSDGLTTYAKLCTDMVQDISLCSPSNMKSARTEEEVDMRRFTWWVVRHIDSTSGWVTGSSSGMSLNASYDIPLPRASREKNDDRTLFERSLFAYLTSLFKLRDDVAGLIMTSKSSQNIASRTEDYVCDLQTRLANFYTSLPLGFLYTRENAVKYTEHGQGPAFLLLHFMFHGMNIIAHCPSVFTEFDGPVPHKVEVAYESARLIVEALLIANSVDSKSVLSNPFFDVPVSLAARIFLAGRTPMVASAVKNFSESWNEARLTACMDVLHDMSIYWAASATVMSNLEQLGAQASRHSNLALPLLPSPPPPPPPSQMEFADFLTGSPLVEFKSASYTSIAPTLDSLSFVVGDKQQQPSSPLPISPSDDIASSFTFYDPTLASPPPPPPSYMNIFEPSIPDFISSSTSPPFAVPDAESMSSFLNLENSFYQDPSSSWIMNSNSNGGGFQYNPLFFQ